MFRSMWAITRRAVVEFINDDAMTLGAALAFYTVLSLSPILVILMSALGLITTDEQQHRIVGQITSTVGQGAGESIEAVLQNARTNRSGGIISATVGLVTLLVGASAVFAQLQYSMNRIWGIEPRPGSGIGQWLRVRGMGLLVVLVIGVVLLVSSVVTATLATVLGPEQMVWRVVNFMVSLLVYTALFGAIYKLLPDVRISWGMTLVGAVVTAALFAVGRAAIGWYLTMASVGSPYGAAGSLLALLVWVYYSSLILFVGAEITQSSAREMGAAISPNRYAQPLPTVIAGDKAVHRTTPPEAR
jgi:membrane protein